MTTTASSSGGRWRPAPAEASDIQSVDVESTRDNFVQQVAASVADLPEKSRRRILDAAITATIADGGFEALGFDSAGAMVDHVLGSSS